MRKENEVPVANVKRLFSQLGREKKSREKILRESTLDVVRTLYELHDLKIHLSRHNIHVEFTSVQHILRRICTILHDLYGRYVDSTIIQLTL